jgi:hypothetical protein
VSGAPTGIHDTPDRIVRLFDDVRRHRVTQVEMVYDDVQSADSKPASASIEDSAGKHSRADVCNKDLAPSPRSKADRSACALMAARLSG